MQVVWYTCYLVCVPSRYHVWQHVTYFGQVLLPQTSFLRFDAPFQDKYHVDIHQAKSAYYSRGLHQIQTNSVDMFSLVQ